VPELDGIWACVDTDGMSDPRPGSQSGRRENVNPKTIALPPTTTPIKTIPAISTVTHQGTADLPVGLDGSSPKNTLVTEVYPNQISRDSGVTNRQLVASSTVGRRTVTCCVARATGRANRRRKQRRDTAEPSPPTVATGWRSGSRIKS
jgi:hypothetical protein